MKKILLLLIMLILLLPLTSCKEGERDYNKYVYVDYDDHFFASKYPNFISTIAYPKNSSEKISFDVYFGWYDNIPFKYDELFFNIYFLNEEKKNINIESGFIDYYNNYKGIKETLYSSLFNEFANDTYRLDEKGIKEVWKKKTKLPLFYNTFYVETALYIGTLIFVLIFKYSEENQELFEYSICCAMIDSPVYS